MLIVYDSLTGMGKRFAAKLDGQKIDINNVTNLEENCLLITRSFGFGNIPDTTKAFLDKNAHRVLGVAVSGNKNWGPLYGNSAKLINKEYNLKIVHIFEGSGFESDIKKVQSFIDEVENGTNT